MVRRKAVFQRICLLDPLSAIEGSLERRVERGCAATVARVFGKQQTNVKTGETKSNSLRFGRQCKDVLE